MIAASIDIGKTLSAESRPQRAAAKIIDTYEGIDYFACVIHSYPYFVNLTLAVLFKLKLLNF
jgi:hypothetical protein